MQIPSTSQISPGQDPRGSSLLFSYESLRLSQERTTIQYAGDGDSFMLSHTKTSLSYEALYTAAGMPVNSETPLSMDVGALEAASGNEAAEEAMVSDAHMEFLETIRIRVQFLFEEAARMSEESSQENREIVSGENGPIGINDVSYSGNIIYESQTTSIVELSLDSSNLSPESTADRIVQFALSLYTGGDREEYVAMVREAIMKGYNEAKAALGGFLPEVSRQTIDLVNQALDEFAAGTDIDLSA